MDTHGLNRRDFLKTSGLGGLALAFSRMANAEPGERPNIVLILCDDLGWGDLGAFGHPTIQTPHLDRMARQGQKWTTFYAAAPVCTPSRAALMTGRLPVRTGMCHDTNRVLFPDSTGGLPEEEVTLAEALKRAGYATACVGKWHLGHLPRYLPIRNGFDSYFGVPYSNDMDFIPPRRADGSDDPRPKRDFLVNPKAEYFNVPLLRDGTVVERPADQATLTRRYTEETVRLIQKLAKRPFFVYLAHNLPHVPLFRSKDFEGKSLRGIYGDVVEEIDSGVGQILETLRRENLDKKTLVIFSSDNGPWLTFNEHGGSAGLLREGKGSTWEGGLRVPTVFWWPGRVRPGVVTDMGSLLDVFATACALSGATMPSDRVMDSLDLTPVLTGTGPGLRTVMFHYRDTTVFAVRKGMYKAHFFTQSGYGEPKATKHDPPLLFHLGVDPGERYDVAKDHPDVIADIQGELKKHRTTLRPVKNQLEDRTGGAG